MLTREQKERKAGLLEEKRRRERQRKFFEVFPDETQRAEDGSIRTLRDGTQLYARHLYPKHLEFFDAGREYRERCFMAANRVGKTVAGCFEDACHLTGLYPDWWTGFRFNRPTRGWVAGKQNETVRDILQPALLGAVTGAKSDKGVDGTGLIPGLLIGKVTWRQGVSDLIDTAKIKHVSGGWSTLGFKAYQQGRGSFEGTAQDFIHDDEEPPMDVYGEQLLRTVTTGGRLYMTFTALEGLTETVLQFMPADQRPDSF